MSLVVNNNMMAANTARNLNAHYGRLATSTQRLSSGLRINSAADDAAGLAIRELQRADIAALQQGARNANDAISMIQVADGSLSIIDEKLLRMKELAEQAATGTYDSTQRLMIESEYQAMASEITRIANATDFNGTKLLDGTLAGDHDGSKMVSEGKMKIHFGTGNDSAEDYYYIEIGECTSEAFGLGNNSTWQDVQRRGVDAFKDSLKQQIKDDGSISEEERGKLLAAVDGAGEELEAALTRATDYRTAFQLWASESEDKGFMKAGKDFPGTSDLMERYLAAAAKAKEDMAFSENTDPAKVLDGIQKEIKDKFTLFTDLPAEVQQQVTVANSAGDTTAAQEALKPYFEQEKEKAVQAARAAGLNETELDFVRAELSKMTPPNSKNAWDMDAKTGLEAAVKAAFNTSTTAVGPTNGAATKVYPAAVATRNQGKIDYLADPEAPIGTTDPDNVFSGIQKEIEDKFTLFTDLPAEVQQQVTVANSATPPDTTAAQEALKPYFEQEKEKAVQAARAAGLNETELDFVRAKLSKMTPPTNETTWNGLGTSTTATAGLGAAVKAAFNTTSTTAVGPTTGAATKVYPAAVATRNQGKAEAKAALEENLDTFWNSLRTTEKQKLQYAWGQAAMYNLANAEPGREPDIYGIGYPKDSKEFEFANVLTGGENADRDSEMLAQALKDMQAKVGHMDFAGHTIETQEDAQMALEAINEAIVSKDKIRAHLGATQNRLENTVSNLNIQAENLQAAESRISDVDVATEMTEFVRNQILTQSAVAMLSQANSLPQMAMQLIGG